VSWTRALLLICLFLSLALIGCASNDDDDASDDDAADDDAVDDDTADDDTSDDDTATDGVTSASPAHQSAQLTESHSGWRNADCFSCHDDVHQSAFAPGECVTCHGANGATRRQAGHATNDCASCHAGQHAGLSFAEQHCTACHKYEESSACPAVEEYDAVVIGAGGGGLAAAATLAKAGYYVALLEKHYKVGGYMTTFRRGGYRFEASLHAMGGLDQPGDFDAMGIRDRLELVRCDPMYRSFYPDLDIEVPSDAAAYQQKLQQMFPDEAEGIAALFTRLADLQLVLDAFTSLEHGFNMEALQTLISHLDAGIDLLRCMFLTLEEFVARYVHDPKLVAVWTQLDVFLADKPSNLQALYFIAMWNSYHFGGYYYFHGGSAAVTEAMADVIRENGGVIRLNTLATKIVIENGRATQVQTQDDVCYNTDYVISNANAPDTMLNMVGAENLPADYVGRLQETPLGAATIQVFLGVDHDYTSLFNSSHEIFVNTTYNQDEAFQYVVDGDAEHVPFAIANYTVVDPTDAPAGKNVIALTTYLPFDLGDEWQWDAGVDEYRSFKEQIAATLIERAEEYLPGLSGHIEVLEVGSPVTNWAYTFNPAGSILGWAGNPEYSTKRRLPPQTPIENLFLAGAWTYPGGGQSAVITSGIYAAGMVIAQDR